MPEESPLDVLVGMIWLTGQETQRLPEYLSALLNAISGLRL